MHTFLHMAASTKLRVLFWGPHNRSPTILGSVLQPLVLGSSHIGIRFAPTSGHLHRERVRGPVAVVPGASTPCHDGLLGLKGPFME